MSPENIKVNGQSVQTEKKELTPVQQWDQLAFSLMERTLASKGFKKISGGRYKGLVIANTDLPGLIKSKVTECQKQAAQLVRGFRDMTRKQITDRIDTAIRLQDDAIRNREACRFWQISKKKWHQKEYEHFRDQIGLLEIMKNQLDQVGIK